jgi:hypothetical protein
VRITPLRSACIQADEQVIEGKCERCESQVVQRELEQWFLKITAYAQKLLDDLDWLGQSEIVKLTQRHWIGRSEGVEFQLAVDHHPGVKILVVCYPDSFYRCSWVNAPLKGGSHAQERCRAIARSPTRAALCPPPEGPRPCPPGAPGAYAAPGR